MNPTGWFQVAWSDEVRAGEVHRMRYFGRDLVDDLAAGPALGAQRT
jgi:hypothetical protein